MATESGVRIEQHRLGQRSPQHRRFSLQPDAPSSNPAQIECHAALGPAACALQPSSTAKGADGAGGGQPHVDPWFLRRDPSRQQARGQCKDAHCAEQGARFRRVEHAGL